jgi:hypothetical protein
MLNNDILKHILSIASIRDIVRFSAISKEIRTQVRSLSYRYNLKILDHFAITMHKLNNRRFLTLAVRKYYINRAIIEQNFALIEQFAKLKKVKFIELLNIAYTPSRDQLRILRFYKHKAQTCETTMLLYNAINIILRRFKKIKYIPPINLINARIIVANWSDDEIRTSLIFQTDEMKTALFESANVALYYEIIERTPMSSKILMVNTTIIDDSVQYTKMERLGYNNARKITYNQFATYIANAKTNYSLISGVEYYFNNHYISLLNNPENTFEHLESIKIIYPQTIKRVLIAHFEIDKLRALSEYDNTYTADYEKLRKQMLSYGMI